MADTATQKQILVLEMAGAEYGFPADTVKEIVRLVEITPVPESPGFLKGVIDYRGDIAVVIDLAARLNLGEAASGLSTQIIIVNVSDHLVGLVVDQVLDIISVDKTEILAARDELPLSEDLVTGAYEDGERLLVLLDLTKILDFNGHEYIAKAKKKAKPKKEAKSKKKAAKS
jgi:purine-binding chemotaxis protein CheW